MRKEKPVLDRSRKR